MVQCNNIETLSAINQVEKRICIEKPFCMNHLHYYFNVLTKLGKPTMHKVFHSNCIFQICFVYTYFLS